jgi:hypothetical protein
MEGKAEFTAYSILKLDWLLLPELFYLFNCVFKHIFCLALQYVDLGLNFILTKLAIFTINLKF